MLVVCDIRERLDFIVWPQSILIRHFYSAVVRLSTALFGVRTTAPRLAVSEVNREASSLTFAFPKKQICFARGIVALDVVFRFRGSPSAVHKIIFPPVDDMIMYYRFQKGCLQEIVRVKVHHPRVYSSHKVLTRSPCLRQYGVVQVITLVVQVIILGCASSPPQF